MWTSFEPLLQEMGDDESRFAGVKRLGVDEHVWHHVSEIPLKDGGRGPKLLTEMVDLIPESRVREAEGTTARPGPRPVGEGVQRLARRT